MAQMVPLVGLDGAERAWFGDSLMPIELSEPLRGLSAHLMERGKE